MKLTSISSNSINHPFLCGEVEPRLFQQTILSTCIKKNTLVVLPTGTGKTMIAILHIAFLLQNQKLLENDGQVLILAPTKPLVHQHLRSFQHFLKLPAGSIIELSGAVEPKKRAALIKRGKIIIATPQTIKNDLLNNHLKPEKVELVYYDEAHRARGDYDYVQIAEAIHDFNPQCRFVALTASPGSNKKAILEICKNLYITAIESRTREDPEIRKYIQEVSFERIEVPLPLEFEVILENLMKLGEWEMALLREKKLTEKTFSFLYKGELLKMKKELTKNFKANYLEIMACNRLLYLLILRETLESQGIPSAYALIQSWREKNSKSIRGLYNLQEFKDITEKIELLNQKGVIHPKLLFLLDILDKTDLLNSRVLIFCNLRATCYAISKALRERDIKAKAFVGQSKTKTGGLSQKKQIAILEAFKRDQFPVLVSTSVLEEGLDVDECKLVIFYDGTPSAIRKIQRSGRTGRKKEGRVIILTTHHSTDTSAHFISDKKERKMQRLLKDISWLDTALQKPRQEPKLAFTPKKSQKTKAAAHMEEILQTEEEEKENREETSEEEEHEERGSEKETTEEKDEEPIVSEKLASFKIALEDMKRWTEKKQKKVEQDSNEKKQTKRNTTEEQKKQVRIIVDSREKNSKILFHLKKAGIDLEFKQLTAGDYILSDRVAVEYKKGDDLLSSIIDGRLFSQLGLLTNAYQTPVLLIEGFPTGGIHPEAIAGALASFMIDFGVSIIQTQNSEESATILKRIAIREQQTKKRTVLIRKNLKTGNPNEHAIQIISSFPGINRTLATRLLESFGSVKKMVNTSLEELRAIEGLGEKKSRKIIEILTREYQG